MIVVVLVVATRLGSSNGSDYEETESAEGTLKVRKDR